MSISRSIMIWLTTAVALLGLAGAMVFSERPSGAISGRVALVRAGFGLASYDTHGKKAYALAIGPREHPEQTVERGVWIQPDGRFQITHLPVGEYTLKLRAPGYQTHLDTSIFVDEGQITQIPPTRMDILTPSVNIASNSRVFTTQDPPTLWINALGATSAQIRFYRSDLFNLVRETNLELSSSLSLYKTKALENWIAKQTPLVTLQRSLNMDSEDWARANIKLDKPLPTGDYLVMVSVKNDQGLSDWNLMWFSVSNLGLVVKQAPEQTLVQAIDLRTLSPMPNTQVKLMDIDHQWASTGTFTTNEQGIASYPMPETFRQTPYFNWVAYGRHGQHHAYGSVSYWRNASEHYKTYFYTERPIYRLGQTVYYKALVRLLEGEGLKTPQTGLPLQLSMSDPDGNEVWNGSTHTNDHGSFHGVFEIPADGKTGAYELRITYPDQSTDYERFEVAQYRKPEYQVSVEPLKKRISAGSSLQTRIRANYFFGAPVAHASVHYTIYETPDWQGYYAHMPRSEDAAFYDDWENDELGYADSSGDYVEEGYAQTDENGEAMITVKTLPLASTQSGPYSSDMLDKRYRVQAEVTDLSRMTVTSSTNFTATRGNLLVYVTPKNDICGVGEPIQADMQVVDYEGNPVSNQAVALNLSRWVYLPRNGIYHEAPLAAGPTLKTNAQGKASVSFLPSTKSFPSDTYQLTARTTDTEGHVVWGESNLWLVSQNSPYRLSEESAAQEPLTVKFDKAVYQPGDTAKVMISAPVTGKEGITAMVAVEGLRLYNYRLIPLEATATMVKVPILKEYAPNAYVTVSFAGPKRQFYTQSEMMKVSPEEHFLKLSVQSDKAKYHPGDTVHYTVQATDRYGHPAKDVEVSLGVVDESIYSIRPEQDQWQKPPM